MPSSGAYNRGGYFVTCCWLEEAQMRCIPGLAQLIDMLPIVSLICLSIFYVQLRNT